MPCSDSSTSMVIKLDNDDLFKSFDYAKINCGREIKTEIHSLNDYFKGKILQSIIDGNFGNIMNALGVKNEEDQFILYMEWDALRCAVGLYLGVEIDEIDTARCRISSIEQTENETEVALVILPPKELPKILPCNLSKENLN